MAAYEVCGCVVVGDAEWAWVGGYTTLHAKPVPAGSQQ